MFYKTEKDIHSRSQPKLRLRAGETGERGLTSVTNMFKRACRLNEVMRAFGRGKEKLKGKR